MEKQTYQTPVMEITRFEAEDIIRTSSYGLEWMPMDGNDYFYSSDHLYS